MTIRARLHFTCAILASILTLSAVGQTWFSRQSARHTTASRLSHLELATLFDLEAMLAWQLNDTIGAHNAMSLRRDGPEASVQGSEAAQLDVSRLRVRDAIAAVKALDAEPGRIELYSSVDVQADRRRVTGLTKLVEELDLEASSALSGTASLLEQASHESKVRLAISQAHEMIADKRLEVLTQDKKTAEWSARAVTTAWLMPIAAMIIVIGLLLNVLRSISGPLAQLAEGAARIAGGVFDIPVPVLAPDELSRLAIAFNDMQVSLKQRIAERNAALIESAHQAELLAKSETFRALSEAAPVGILEIVANPPER